MGGKLIWDLKDYDYGWLFSYRKLEYLNDYLNNCYISPCSSPTHKIPPILKKKNKYTLLKKKIETYMLKKKNLKYLILRPSSIYGYKQKDKTLLLNKINEIKRKNSVVFFKPLSQKFNFIHAHDVCRAILFLIKKKYSVLLAKKIFH